MDRLATYVIGHGQMMCMILAPKTSLRMLLCGLCFSECFNLTLFNTPFPWQSTISFWLIILHSTCNLLIEISRHNNFVNIFGFFLSHVCLQHCSCSESRILRGAAYDKHLESEKTEEWGVYHPLESAEAGRLWQNGDGWAWLDSLQNESIYFFFTFRL